MEKEESRAFRNKTKKGARTHARTHTEGRWKVQSKKKVTFFFKFEFKNSTQTYVQAENTCSGWGGAAATNWRRGGNLYKISKGLLINSCYLFVLDIGPESQGIITFPPAWWEKEKKREKKSGLCGIVRESRQKTLQNNKHVIKPINKCAGRVFALKPRDLWEPCRVAGAGTTTGEWKLCGFFSQEIFDVLLLQCRVVDQTDKHPPRWEKKGSLKYFSPFWLQQIKTFFQHLRAHAHTHTCARPHKHKHAHTRYRLTPLDKSWLEHLAAVGVRVNRWRLNLRLRYKQLDKSQSIAAIATATAQYFHRRHSLGLGNRLSTQFVRTHENTS